MDWQTGYWRQAQSDYRVYLFLKEQEDIPFCHQLHYLQMATEKMAKGFLSTPTVGYPPTHDALFKFIKTGNIDQRVKIKLKFGPSKKDVAFKEYRKGLETSARQLEDLSPDGGPHPNPEYPWKDATGRIHSPLTHSFPEFGPGRHTQMNKLFKFIDVCFEYVSEELGD